MVNETQLWAWFLFGGALTAQRAKTLLLHWTQKGLTLSDALGQLPAKAASLDLTPEETAKLNVPQNLPDVAALRWNAPLYPQGLLALPFKARPALLFYTGQPHLLQRPIVYLSPDPLSEVNQEVLQEAIAMLLGEPLLFAAFQDSPQATLLLEEVATSEGEALLFTKEGLSQYRPSDRERELLDAGKLLLVTPLPPTTPTNPAWDTILQQVAIHAAARSVHSHATSVPEMPSNALRLDIASPSSHHKPGVQTANSAGEIVAWLMEIPTPAEQEAPPTTTVTPVPSSDEPPPSPEEMLHTLEKGGRVPEVLRKKLLQH